MSSTSHQGQGLKMAVNRSGYWVIQHVKSYQNINKSVPSTSYFWQRNTYNFLRESRALHQIICRKLYSFRSYQFLSIHNLFCSYKMSSHYQDQRSQENSLSISHQKVTKPKWHTNNNFVLIFGIFFRFSMIMVEKYTHVQPFLK